jgi:peptidylprolyl isomerase
MPPAKKRKQQRVSRERAARAARAAALARARRRRNRQRAVYAGVAIVAVVAIVGLVLAVTGGGDDKTDVAADDTTTTAAAATGSAAGKPCVELADPLPQGAPPVPVKVGPPPAELIKEDLKPGTGPAVNPTDNLTVHYIGVSCSTGKIFDSSYSRNEPAQFALDQVIPGWQQGIPGMLVGGQRLLGIPSDLAYGPQGRPPTIAPSEALWFVVEVLAAQPAAAGGAAVPPGG